MLFGKKKEEKQEVIQEQTHPAVDELMKRINTLESMPAAPVMQQPARPMMQRAAPEEMPRKVDFPKPLEEQEMKEEQKSSFAPLFVKIDRYRQILSTMNYLKNSIMLIKNNFAILNELENLRAENIKLLQETLERLDKKISSLDTQFLRPSGFMEDMEEVQDAGALEATISDLSGQIEEMKAQLQSLA